MPETTLLTFLRLLIIAMVANLLILCLAQGRYSQLLAGMRLALLGAYGVVNLHS